MHAVVDTMILGAALFAATDLDDLLLLVALFADPGLGAGQIVAGQMLGIGALFALSVAGSFAALVVPATSIGLLGLVPIGFGAARLIRGDFSDKGAIPGVRGSNGATVATVTLLTLANGGDNVASYTPLFATRTGSDIALIGVTFAAMVAVWCAAARWLVRHPVIGAAVRRAGARALPFVLIGLGLLILGRSGALAVLRPR